MLRAREGWPWRGEPARVCVVVVALLLLLLLLVLLLLFLCLVVVLALVFFVDIASASVKHIVIIKISRLEAADGNSPV